MMRKKIRNRSLRLESLEDRVLLAVTAGGEAAAAAIYAAPAETGADVVVTELTYDALRKAVGQVSAGGTITFQDGLEGTITIGSALQIGRNMTIDGGGKITLAGAGENFLFNFGNNATDVTFTGLDLTGGVATQYQIGGIAAIGAGKTVTLNNCTVYGNTATDSANVQSPANMGGAFYVTGTLNVNNCTVYGNEAVAGGSPTSTDAAPARHLTP